MPLAPKYREKTASATVIGKLRERCPLYIVVTASKYSEVPLMKGSKPCTASAAERGVCVGLQQELPQGLKKQGYPSEAARLNKDQKPATDSRDKNGIFSNSPE